MKYMKASKFVEYLQSSGMTVFSVAEASRIIGKSRKYASLYLSRLAGQGYIDRIEKGKFCLHGASIYAVASNIKHPSYISMLAAFKYYGLTSQNISTIDVISGSRHKPIEWMEYYVSFRKVPRKLIFGFYRSNEDGAFIAYFEKALIDSLLIGNIPLPYIEEAYRNAKDQNMIDDARLASFIKISGSKSLGNRIKSIEESIEEMAML